jgi:thiopeptide-type bacteriocin biosynthesis protein
MPDTPALVELVVSSLAQAELPAELQRCTPAERGTFARLREAFLAAGTAHIQQLLSETWLQAGLSFRDAEQQQRLLASGSLPELVEHSQARAFFFMRKPPGMRLRFLLPQQEQVQPIVSWLEHARDEGLFEQFEYGIYDPETHQFGGPRGLDIFHGFSTCDSLSVLKFEALEAAGRASIDRRVLSLLVLNDLVARVAEDPWEQWDVWSEMELTGRRVDPDSEVAQQLRQDLDSNRELLRSLLFSREEVLAELLPEERALVDGYAQANVEVARALREAARARELSCGPRKILPFFVIFHWNRLGLELDEQVALTFFQWEELDPKRRRP